MLIKLYRSDCFDYVLSESTKHEGVYQVTCFDAEGPLSDHEFKFLDNAEKYIRRVYNAKPCIKEELRFIN